MHRDLSGSSVHFLVSAHLDEQQKSFCYGCILQYYTYAGMGMELQYAMNFSFASPRNKSDVITIARGDTADSWASTKKGLLKEEHLRTDFRKLQEAMERLHEQYNRECMKKTMLKHEETFKEQVRELHRLYKVQKLLMAELRNEDQNLHSVENSATRGTISASDYSHNTDYTSTGFWSSGTISPTSHSLFSSCHSILETNGDYSFHQPCRLRLNPSSQVCSSSCSRDTFSSQRSFDLKPPTQEEILSDEQVQIPLKDKLRIDSPRERDNCYELESEIELTLSTGCSTDSKKQEKPRPCLNNIELGCCSDSVMPSSSLVRSDCAERREGMFPADECVTPLDQKGLQRPPWLFGVLSFNRT